MNSPRVYLLALLGSIAALSLGESTAAAAKTYRNFFFGVEIDLPDDLTTCHEEGEEEDEIWNHGFVILLDAKNKEDCESYEARNLRNINMFAFYNIGGVTDTLPDLLRMFCNSHYKKSSCLPARKNIRIPMLVSLATRQFDSNGGIEITVYAQGGSPRPEAAIRQPGEPVHSVNYLFSVTTDRDHLKQDLHRFRKILSDIRFIQRKY